MRGLREEIWVCHLGSVPYAEAVELQERLRAAGRRGELPDLLLLLEHPPVYTLGRRSGAERPADGRGWLPRAGASTSCDTDRGGKLTYHGPGQLVGYPIMHVDDVIALLRTMERAIVAALGRGGLEARGARRARAATTPASGSRTARSPRSASTSRAACPRTASRSTSTTTSQPFELGRRLRPARRADDLGRAPRPAAPTTVACFRKRIGLRASRRRSAAASGSSRRGALAAARLEPSA